MRALLLFLLLVRVAYSQPEAAPKAKPAVPLYVTAAETRTVVTKLPARISAPPGEDFYLWDHPAAWTTSKPKGKPYILVIEAASNGTHLIKIVCLTKGKGRLEGAVTIVIDVKP